MGTISKVEVCAKNKNRANVFVDGEFFASAFLEVCYKNKLIQGKMVTDNELKKVLEMDEIEKAKTLSFSYVAKCFKTKKEVETYLAKKGFNVDAIQNALNLCENYGYLSDENFAKEYIRCKQDEYSKKQIFHELKLKGIMHEIIEKELENFSDFNVATKLTKKYFKNKECTNEHILKLKNNLARKGFSFDVVSRVVGSLGEDDESWN